MENDLVSNARHSGEVDNCSYATCRKNGSIDPLHEQIYLEQREEEIRSNVGIVDEADTYEDELKALFKIPGYGPNKNREATIYDDTKYDSVPVLDLRPKDKRQMVIYNNFIIDEYAKEYKKGEGFSENYKWFDFEKEKALLKLRLIDEDDIKPVEIIKYAIEEFEKNLNAKLPESLQKGFNIQSESMGYFGNDLLQIMVGNGKDKPKKLKEFILDQFALCMDGYLQFIITWERCKFYKYLLKCKEYLDIDPMHFKKADALEKNSNVGIQDNMSLGVNADINTESESSTLDKTKKLTIPEIALLHVYSGKKIIGELHASEIVATYGFVNQTSGKKLYEAYKNYSVDSNRTRTNESKATKRNMIIRITNILPLLTNGGKVRAENEIKLLS